MATIYIPDENLKDYLFTLEVCKKELPPDAHIEHYKRLNDLTGEIEWKIKQTQ